MNKKKNAILLIALGLMSCGEESIDSVDTFNENDNLKSRFLNVQPSSHLRVYYDNGDPDGKWGEDWGCKGTGGNCLETIVIDIPRLSSKGYNITIKTIVSGNQEEIKKHFSSNKKEILLFLQQNLVEGVIVGELTVTHKGNDSSFVLIFKDRKENIVAVQPFVE